MATSSSDGKTEKSSGFFTNIVVSRMISANMMFTMIRMSSSHAGIGTTSSRTMPTTPTGTAYVGNFFLMGGFPEG